MIPTDIFETSPPPFYPKILVPFLVNTTLTGFFSGLFYAG
jgi:hypothetical protein